MKTVMITITDVDDVDYLRDLISIFFNITVLTIHDEVKE
tara:strand:+ start:302 stop:418 length:117 start_codon:yes stop_codon:yes gene_type:complete